MAAMHLLAQRSGLVWDFFNQSAFLRGKLPDCSSIVHFCPCWSANCDPANSGRIPLLSQLVLVWAFVIPVMLLTIICGYFCSI